MLQISQRPLTGSSADRELFVDRMSELDRLKKASQLGFNIIVLAERGAGVTSLMRQYQVWFEEWGEESYPARCYFVNGDRASNLKELVDAISVTIAGKWDSSQFSSSKKTYIDYRERYWRTLTEGGYSDPIIELRDISNAANQETQGVGAVIILDNMHKPELVHGLFGRHRDELWGMPVDWIVCGRISQRGEYLEPPADAFFDTELIMSPLDGASSRELLERRLAATRSARPGVLERIRSEMEEIIERGGGNPRRLLEEARVVALRDSEESKAAKRLVEISAQLGSTEMNALRHLLSQGARSASDKELNEALGVTRARATQVLNRLEAWGLVHSFVDRSGIGRPRKLYIPNFTYAELPDEDDDEF